MFGIDQVRLRGIEPGKRTSGYMAGLFCASALVAFGIVSPVFGQEAAPLPEERPDDMESMGGEARSPDPAPEEEADKPDAPADEAGIYTRHPNLDPGKRETSPPAVAVVPLPEEKPEQPKETAAEPKSSDNASNDDGSVRPPAQIDAPSITSSGAVRAAAAILDARTCEADLEARGVVFEVDESEAEGSCGVLRPLAVSELSSGVAIAGKTHMWCHTARMLDIWVSDMVLPAAQIRSADQKLTELREVSTYVCRNRASGRKISEHARGSAIDIGAFGFGEANVPVKAASPDTPDGKFLASVREGACGPFTTVLGPGTDADHARHFHFDLAERKNGPYCR